MPVLACTPVIYEYTALFQPLPARSLAQSNRQSQAKSFSAFSLSLWKTQQIIFGSTFPELSGTQSKLLNTDRVERVTGFHLKTSLEVHTHTLCISPSLHLSLNPFPEWSRRSDCPAGETLARSDLSLPRQAPCKAMSKPQTNKKTPIFAPVTAKFPVISAHNYMKCKHFQNRVSKLNTNAYTAETYATLLCYKYTFFS